jgi:4-amino-4-deoxy-L-arabinose transferase-like glycosyltransferase
VAWRTGSWLPWFGVALAIGVGVLAKGPAILLHILPVALFAPWWGSALANGPDRPLISWRAWYARLGLALLVGAAIALLWAIPAGLRGGPEYREMIFWGQSAGRIVESFDHARPIWWYVVLLPPLLLPWMVWPRFWRGLGKERVITFADGGIRLLVAWALPALIIFSIISGKQLHYLLPEFAAFALFIARALSRHAGETGRRFDSVVVAVFFMIIGIILLLLPDEPTFFEAPAWFDRIDTFWGFLLILTGAALWILGRKPAQTAASALAVAMSILVLVIHLSAKDPLSFAYDLRPIAMSLKKYEDAGRPLANFGYYHGQYQFLGRLQKPMTVLGVDQPPTDFVDAHPDAIIVAYYYIDEPQPIPDDITPLETFRFRDFKVMFWQGRDLQLHPELGNRS